MEVDPTSKCNSCDHLCEQNSDFNPDQECVGRMTEEERLAYYDYLVNKFDTRIVISDTVENILKMP